MGYYIGMVTGRWSRRSYRVNRHQRRRRVAENVIEKQEASYQTASGVGTGAVPLPTYFRRKGLPHTADLLNDRQLVGRADARTMLESMGVQFPGGKASATFWSHSGTLIVRNTQDNLDMVDALVDQANASAPKQVSIESKFVEINQNNAKELGFDWLLGPLA